VDEFVQEQAERKAPGMLGWWERVLPQLSDDQRESLMEAAVSRDIKHSTIAIVLRRWGFDVNQAMVGHWRRNHVG